MALNKRERELLLSKYNGHCAYCGKEITLKEMQADHINPMFRGWGDDEVAKGVDSIDNMNPSCRPCNRWKATFTVEQFRAEMESQVARLMRDSAGFRMAICYGLVKETEEKVVFYFEKTLVGG